MMIYKNWNYNGDVSIREGGCYWKEVDALDYVVAVSVEPLPQADNLFFIQSGAIYMPQDDKRTSEALDCIGETLETVTRADIVHAWKAYHGIECDIGPLIVRIGPDETGGDIKPDVVLRSNASLRNYIKREFLA